MKLNRRRFGDKMKKQADAAIRVSVVTLAVNAVLTLVKFAAGAFAHSGAMVSDAVHSASDVMSTLIVIAGVGMSRKKKDAGHPYGHDRMENVASLILSFILFMTGLAIGYDAVSILISGEYRSVMPGLPALAAAVVSICVKEWMYRYTKAVAVREKLMSLMADAWHHRSDALSSVGALIGIAGARLGFPAAEPVASAVICVFIVKTAVEIFSSAVDGVVDRSAPESTEEAIREAAAKVEGVSGVDLLETRRFGSGFYVDLEISVDGEMKLYDAHSVAETVHDRLETEFPDIKHCMIHVNPCRVGNDADDGGASGSDEPPRE